MTLPLCQLPLLTCAHCCCCCRRRICCCCRQVILNPHLFHGAFLLDPATKANVAAEVRGLLATSGSLVVRLARPVVNRTLSAARSLLHEVETLTSRYGSAS